jgi:hypothetical protein
MMVAEKMVVHVEATTWGSAMQVQIVFGASILNRTEIIK